MNKLLFLLALIPLLLAPLASTITTANAQIKFANDTALNMNSTQACKRLYEFANDTGPMSTVNDSLKLMQKQFMDSTRDPVKNFMPDPPRALVADCMGIDP